MSLDRHPGTHKDDRIIFGEKAFSLVEVIVAAVIFTLSMTGIYASLRSLASLSENQDIMINKALYGQKFLQSLRLQVSSIPWAGGAPLAIGGPYAIPADLMFPGYAGTYTVTADAYDTRKVKLTINTP